MSWLTVEDKAAAKKHNRWVDPSFTDLPPQRKNELKRSRKRKGAAGCSNLTVGPVNVPPRAAEDEPWVDRYSPSCQAELAVHKKKTEEVETWLRAHTATSKQGGVLLLTGPSGCGKTATVRVLSRELNIRIQEWTNYSNLESYSSSQYVIVPLCLSEFRMNDLSCSSQSAQFKDFLLRANKYNWLKIVGDDESTDKKLILVEDFPNQFYRQPGSLHDILRQFVKSSRCPLVFIVSDSVTGDCSARSLFPKDLQEELSITSISFNPVAPTALMKVLTRISTVEAGKSCGKMRVLDAAALESLCSGCSGDVRSAINSLQFMSFPVFDLFNPSKDKGLWSKKDGPVSSGTRPTKKTRPKKVNQPNGEAAIGGKDATLFLFRALGKILHCKRGSPEGPEAAALPSHLAHHHRDPLLVSPEMVVEHSHMSGEVFNLYLHQNYLDFFSEVDDVAQASKYLSDADLLAACWMTRSVMRDYGSSVATRGILYSNTRQTSVGFRPLHKPNWLLVNRTHQENCLAAQSLFGSFCLTPVSLQTELLPYLPKLGSAPRSQAQLRFIQDVAQMSLRRFPCRLKLEALTDKDPGELKMAAEEEQEDKACPDGAEAPQPAAGQGLLDEEEMRIEQFDSD
uniref:RAD17 checkpoint clamp loader component n=1 Tax=Tetraodon nigroviridis TaxID=99883 RepID=H3CZ30_TETNG